MKRWQTSQAGFTLIEVLTSLVVFGLISGAIYTAFFAQVKHTTRQYSLAKSSMDIQIIKNLIERDIAMAGFGLAESFDSHQGAATLTTIRAIKARNTSDVVALSDEIKLTGTALGLTSSYAQGWTVVKGTAPVVWTDDTRDSLRHETRYVAMNPYNKQLSEPWIGEYNSSAPNTTLPQGTLLYALYSVHSGGQVTKLAADVASTTLMPAHEVRYDLYNSTGSDPFCVSGTFSLGRSETRTIAENGARTPLLRCVLNLQVAFGLDQDNDDEIDLWDNGGVNAALLSRENLNAQLKQVRVYVLSQASERENNYQSLSPIRVGETDLSTGADITLTTAQKEYQWNLLTLTVTPRNLR